MNSLQKVSLIGHSNKALLLLILSLSPAAGFTAECCDLQKEFINSNQSFSQVVTVAHGDIKTLYISGQVGIRDGLVPELFSEQADNVFINIKRQLAAAGATPNDVIKLTGFIVDINTDRVAQYAEARSRHFSDSNSPPASSLLGISGLVRDNLLLEVEAIAVIEDN